MVEVKIKVRERGGRKRGGEHRRAVGEESEKEQKENGWRDGGKEEVEEVKKAGIVETGE